MKTLYIITRSNWGGAQRYVYDLATSIQTRGHSVSVALGGEGGENAPIGTLGAKLAEANISYYHLRSFSRAVSFTRDIRVAIELYRTIRDYKPDVVHLNSSKAAGVGAVAARLCGVKTIVFTVHGFPYTDTRPWYERALITFATWLTLLLVTDIIIICTPDRIRAETYRGVRHKIRVIANGIKETDERSPLPKTRARARFIKAHPALADLPAETQWIATGTELTERKGIHAFINALAQLSKDAPPYHLLIIGTGDAEDELRAQVRREKLEERVTFLGFVPQLEEVLSAFDLFVMASRKEGLPYILLEVARAGVPIIASNIDGIPDIITDQSEGLLIDPLSSESIADALEETLKDPEVARTRADALARTIATRFSLTRMTESTLAVYRRDTT